jgi:chemotaxis protein MotB
MVVVDARDPTMRASRDIDRIRTRFIQKEKIIMQLFTKTTILATSVAIVAGCSSYIKQPVVCISDGWYGYEQSGPCPSKPVASPVSDSTAARLAALERERQRLAEDLVDTQRRLADHDRELASLRSGAVESAKPAKAERGLLKALQPEIAKGTVSVHQSGDVLTINLASGLLFDSGQDQLKGGGTAVLQRVGSVLKDFPDTQVHVAGYTDNVAIRSALKKKYPSNQELSGARADNAAQALRDGGVSSHLSSVGHGDSNPVASNNTVVGRAKNRRVEIIVS